MKNTLLGLAAATLLATPAFAISWKDKLWTSLDVDQSGEVTYGELIAGGCPTDIRLFKYADTDKNGALSKAEYFAKREVLGRCK